jgi:hypothetical protein
VIGLVGVFGLVETIQMVIAVIRLLDDVLDALARKHPESGELASADRRVTNRAHERGEEEGE